MAKDRFDTIQEDIVRQRDMAHQDRAATKRLLKKLEDGKRRVAVFFTRQDKSLTQYDVLPFSSMLKSLGVTENLDLVVVNNGGEGTTAETFLDLCRKYCKSTLRVVVPLYAKSAATLLALGADEIVMGETSELGPIDAQVVIIQDNSPQQVSADHFLRARNRCLKELASGEQSRIDAAQIQLALLSPAFLQQCEDLMDFGRDFAKKQLKAHMFSAEHVADAAKCGAIIDAIVNNLTSTSKYLSHGRMITPFEIQADPELKHLKVLNLERDDPYWLTLSELLLRISLVAQLEKVGKVLLTSDFLLFGR